MIFLIFGLILIHLSANPVPNSHGAWLLTYLQKDQGCTGQSVIATHYVDYCVRLPYELISFQFACYRTPRNFTSNFYHGNACEGSIIETVHMGETYECTNENSDYSKQYVCDYTLDYKNLGFGAGMKHNRSDPGAPQNPIVAHTMIPIGECFPLPLYFNVYHVTTTCNKNTQVGTMQFFDEGDSCDHSFHQLELNPGDIIDIGKIMHLENSYYWVYNGC